MMLTGVDNHVAGLGNMAEFMAPNQAGNPGYEGYINDRVATVSNCSPVPATTPSWPASGTWGRSRSTGRRPAASRAT